MKIIFDIRGYYPELSKINTIASSIKGFKIISNNIYKSREGSIRAELEYSRCYSNIGAHIITTATECLEVQEYFIDSLEEHNISLLNLEYRIVSIAMDFKYKMELNKDINSYTRVFSYMNSISEKIGYKILSGKQELLGGELQDIRFYNTTTKTSLNIYNLFNRIKESHGKNEALEEARESPEILRDMIFRITIYSKANLRELESFAEHNIYAEAFEPFQEKLLEFFDPELLEEEIEREVLYYNKIFNKRSSNFRWDSFVFQYDSKIRSYSALRRSMKTLILSRKGLEQAVTKVRRFISRLEEMDGKIRINTIKTFQNIRKHLKNLELTSDDIY